MARELKFTSKDFTGTADEDCYLSPDDPLYDLINPGNNSQLKREISNWEAMQSSPEMKFAKEHNIKPGTPAWHALWNQ